MPEERQGTCKDDYNNASWSWETVLKPHRRTPDQPKTKITVNYGPGNGEYDLIAEMSQKLQLLENTAEHLSEVYVWRTPIGLEMRSCGDPGARWDFKLRKAIVCYEIMADFAQLFRKYGHLEIAAHHHNYKHKK